MTTDKEHLQWMLNRLTEVHGENRNIDYMMRMQQIIDNTETELNLHLVSHSYYQVVYNGYDDDIEEVTSALPTLERAKKALEANKAYFDEEMYIIAKINCG